MITVYEIIWNWKNITDKMRNYLKYEVKLAATNLNAILYNLTLGLRL